MKEYIGSLLMSIGTGLVLIPLILSFAFEIKNGVHLMILGLIIGLIGMGTHILYGEEFSSPSTRRSSNG